MLVIVVNDFGDVGGQGMEKTWGVCIQFIQFRGLLGQVRKKIR